MTNEHSTTTSSGRSAESGTAYCGRRLVGAHRPSGEHLRPCHAGTAGPNSTSHTRSKPLAASDSSVAGRFHWTHCARDLA